MYKARILILEDHLETLSLILDRLSQIELLEISPVVISEASLVEKLINASDETFDLILLDKDCISGSSFHVFDIEKFGADKVISISSVPENNEDAVKRGVTKVVLKDYQHLDRFADELLKDIKLYFKTI